jgi:amidase
VHNNQDLFIQTQEQQLAPDEYNKVLQHLRSISRDQGIDRILKEYDVDVIIGPADSFITSLATASGMLELNRLDLKARTHCYQVIQWLVCL